MKNSMKTFVKIGRAFYGIRIIAFGVQQILIKDFGPEILSPFPAWAHEYIVFSILTGIALVITTGIIVTGFFSRAEKINIKKLCLYLGFYFVVLIILSQLPYTLMLIPNKSSHLGVWAEALKELAFCGGAFVMADSFAQTNLAINKLNAFELMLQRIIPLGKIFFSTTMILYGCSHLCTQLTFHRWYQRGLVRRFSGHILAGQRSFVQALQSF